MIRFLTVVLFALGLAIPTTPQAQEAAPAIELAEMTMGNPDAKVRVIEYASFTCPHCATFHREVLPRLQADYIDPGKIHFTYREVYFDRYGLWAAMVARCGGTERYFGLSGLLYETQRDWATLRDAAAAASELRRIGKIGGLDEGELEACLSDIDTARAMVAKSDADTKADDITATPSLVINGKTYKNMSYDDLRKVLDEALAK